MSSNPRQCGKMSLIGIMKRRNLNATWILWTMALTNIVAMCYFILMLCMTTYLGLFCIIPQLYGREHFCSAMFQNGIILFLFINAAGNFTCVMFTDTTLDSLKGLPHKVKKYGFNRVCKKCQVRVPGRAHHCTLCDTCILKRDHHCFFMCTCIGYHNQKYFIMYCFYQCIAGIYAAFYILIYLRILYNVKLSGITSFIGLLTSTLQSYWVSKSVSFNHITLVVIS